MPRATPWDIQIVWRPIHPVADSAGLAGSYRSLRAAVIDVMATGTLESSEVLPATEPYDRDFSLRQRRPAAARVRDRIFVAWETESPLADPLRAEFFVASSAGRRASHE